MKVIDLPSRITATKADWLPGTDWLGFTPASHSPGSRNACQSAIKQQMGDGYVLEYVTRTFGKPKPSHAKPQA